MKKVIRLTESELVKLIKIVLNESNDSLPILPENRLYEIYDFIDSTTSWKLTDLPSIINNKIGIIYHGEGANLIDDVIKENNITKLCQIIGTDTSSVGARPILYPFTKEGSPTQYPPAKYVCFANKYLKLVPINNTDAQIIASKEGGVNYLKTLDASGKPYLVGKKTW